MPRTTTRLLDGHFCPMRPISAARLYSDNAVELVRAAAETHIIQPKLNGDRVLLVKRNGSVSLFNRKRGEYGYRLDTRPWLSLPDDTILDGEGWRHGFYPFDVLMVGGESHIESPVESRTAEAKRICLAAGQDWLFDTPTDAWLLNGADLLPTWEGVVCKLKGSKYTPLAFDRYQSWEWFKLKW